jgi:MFS transporter, CP family, cyanate transporter
VNGRTPALPCLPRAWGRVRVGVLLWLAGIALRLTILAVPPVISLIQSDLRLSGTEIGILSGLPMVLFGCAALPGSLLIARFGALSTLVLGLLAAAIASGLRGAVPNASALYATTIVMSAGIAVMQPALPPLARQWLPQHVSFATAVFTNGLLVGETLAVMLTIPVVLPLVDGSWRGAFAVWSIPMFLIAFVTMWLAPKSRKLASGASAGPRLWWPNWRNKQIWQLGFLLGSVNSVYFCSNAFLPGYLTEAGRPDLVAGALTALNLGQLPASFVLLATSRRIERRAWPFILCGTAMVACLGGIVTTASLSTVMFSGVLGFLGAVVLTLSFALPPLLCAPADVARMTAAMLTISYSEGLIVSVLSGAAWDIAGSARAAFLPIAVSALPLVLLSPSIRLRRTAPVPG